MTKDVIVSISGLQMDMDQEMPVEVITMEITIIKMVSITYYLMKCRERKAPRRKTPSRSAAIVWM